VGILGLFVFFVVRNESAKHQVPPEESTSVEEGLARQEVRTQVLGFGERLREVSLLAPTAPADIERVYRPYVTRSLLSAWISYPQNAPGRETSSPWPDHIDIAEVTMSDDASAATVTGVLVYMTSEGIASNTDAGSETIALTLVPEDGVWKIDRYEVIRTNSANAPRTQGERPMLE